MTAQSGPLNERIAALVKDSPLLANIIQAPPGTDLEVWRIAARWADVPLSQLLADTAQVKSSHYAAALRVWESLQLAPCTDGVAAAGDRLAEELAQMGEDPFIQLMFLAETMAAETSKARDLGDAAQAAEYSSFETALLQVAAGIQAIEDKKMEGQQ